MSFAMELKLYDTLTREKRTFMPIDPARVVLGTRQSKAARPIKIVRIVLLGSDVIRRLSRRPPGKCD